MLPKDEIDSWQKPTNQRKRFSSLSEVPLFGAIPDVQVEWTVEGLLPRASVTVIAGQPGHLKSFLALDLARRVAAGAAFAGSTTRQGKVLYLDRENPAAARKSPESTSAGISGSSTPPTGVRGFGKPAPR